MKIALLQSHVGHYYRIQHLINTLRINNELIEIYNIDDINKCKFDILLLEYFSSHTSNPHDEMVSRINSFKSQLLGFGGKLILYNVDDGQAVYIREIDYEIANRIDAWFVYMIRDDFLNDNQLIKSILKPKFVLIPRYTLPYTKSDDVIYENKENKIVFIGRSTGNYWFFGKNWRVECLNKIWDNKFLRDRFDGWMVDDNIIDTPTQSDEYNSSMKFIKKNEYLSESDWYRKLKNNTLSLCIPGHTKYGYRHPQSMVFKSTMLANFDMTTDPYQWFFSDKLSGISYTVNDDLSNFIDVCEESLVNREKTKMYADNAYDVYRTYFEPTTNNEYQYHIWELICDNLVKLNIYDI